MEDALQHFLERMADGLFPKASRLKVSIRSLEVMSIMFVSVSFNEASPELANHKQIKVPIQKGNRVADVMDYIKNRYPDLPVKRESHLVLVNRRITSFEQVLNEDDEISFTPIIGGG